MSRCEELLRLHERAMTCYPKRPSARAAFRKGCLAAWSAQTIRHCPYALQGPEVPDRLAWLDGFGWGVLQNDESTKAVFG